MCLSIHLYNYIYIYACTFVHICASADAGLHNAILMVAYSRDLNLNLAWSIHGNLKSHGTQGFKKVALEKISHPINSLQISKVDTKQSI